MLFTGYIIFWVLVMFMMIGVLVASVFLYLQGMNLLNACSAENRKMEPGMVWLGMIPYFGIGWTFYAIMMIRDSLKLEFEHRNLQTSNKEFDFSLGLTACILMACFYVLWWIPILGVLLGIAAVIVTVLYLLKLKEYADILNSKK